LFLQFRMCRAFLSRYITLSATVDNVQPTSFTDLVAMTDVGIVYDQGLANRRVGATAMNSESSRSHSVFTCVIESRSKVPNLHILQI